VPGWGTSKAWKKAPETGSYHRARTGPRIPEVRANRRTRHVGADVGHHPVPVGVALAMCPCPRSQPEVTTPGARWVRPEPGAAGRPRRRHGGCGFLRPSDSTPLARRTGAGQCPRSWRGSAPAIRHPEEEVAPPRRCPQRRPPPGLAERLGVAARMLVLVGGPANTGRGGFTS
jgi:hypothetical protein